MNLTAAAIRGLHRFALSGLAVLGVMLIAQGTGAQVELPKGLTGNTKQVRYSDLREFAAAVRDRIKANLVSRPDVPDSASATFEIALSDAGALVELKLTKTSDVPSYDQMIRQAISFAQPYPVFVDRTGRPQSVRLSLKFKARD
jgi:hypothetical protein